MTLLNIILLLIFTMNKKPLTQERIEELKKLNKNYFNCLDYINNYWKENNQSPDYHTLSELGYNSGLVSRLRDLKLLRPKTHVPNSLKLTAKGIQLISDYKYSGKVIKNITIQAIDPHSKYFVGYDTAKQCSETTVITSYLPETTTIINSKPKAKYKIGDEVYYILNMNQYNSTSDPEYTPVKLIIDKVIYTKQGINYHGVKSIDKVIKKEEELYPDYVSAENKIFELLKD